MDTYANMDTDYNCIYKVGVANKMKKLTSSGKIVSKDYIIPKSLEQLMLEAQREATEMFLRIMSKNREKEKHNGRDR